MRQHGTRSRYSTGCRCQPCRKAAADSYQRWKAARDLPYRRLYWPIVNLFDAAGTTEYLALAKRTGISARTLHRAAHRGLPDRSADHAATTLGIHPSLIWPDWFDPYLKEQAA
jgi:lambda repressor-like predicted transcriptional regulator